jgi:DNA (cytosine-5)-methyltransferase 1
MSNPKKPQLTFIDLFAGIGGFHTAFHSVGCDCVFASEWDEQARKTYIENYKDLSPSIFEEGLFSKGENLFEGDIIKVKEKNIPKFDILCAGFPCQPFSNAGLKKGFEDSRGTLFFDIARIIKHHKPRVVFLENVKGFKNHDKGNTFEVIKKTLEDMGYKIFTKILNAKDFGVPQNRERIYIIGFLDEVDFKFPEAIGVKTKLGNILEKKVDKKYTLSDKLWAGHQRRKKEHKEKGNGFGYSMFTEDSEYTSTISARYYKDGSEILIEQKNKNPRKVTPREAARLQGYPENFKIPVSDTQAYKQFGNSVAVPVITALAQAIKKAIT